ncbi:MAG: guanylate kinase [Acidobacteria bacterium]|nr:MAG: guanylate kinase [Acidobacteriota bacterium]
MNSLFIISAPSGSGKSTLVKELFARVDGLRFSVSYTTRTPRGSERDGIEYHFVGRGQFEAMMAADAFLEHAQVFGNYYGTARASLAEAGRAGDDLVLDIDVQGAAQVKQRLPEAVSIFIAPPDRGQLEWRLKSRGLDTPEVVAQRLHDAAHEIAAYNSYDYVVINDRLPESVEQLCAIVRCRRSLCAGDCAIASQCQQSRMAARMQPVLESFGVRSC